MSFGDYRSYVNGAYNWAASCMPDNSAGNSAGNSAVDNSNSDFLVDQFYCIPSEPVEKDTKSEKTECLFTILSIEKNWSCCMQNATMRKIIEKCAESFNVDERKITILTHEESEFWAEVDPDNEFHERGFINLTNVDRVDEFLLNKGVSLSLLGKMSMIGISFKKFNTDARWAPMLTIEEKK